MRVVDVSGPREPGAGEVVVRPEAVGLCGSDLHYFLGDIGAVSDSELYPRVHWHEAAGIVELLAAEEGVDVVVAAREWTGGEGPEVVFEATGVPDVVRTAVELVSQAGRVVVVGLSGHDAPLKIGDLAFKEIDVLGVSCCNADEFADAVALVARREGALRGLVTHEFPLEETPAAIEYAIRHPADVMKAVIRLDAS